MDQISIGAAPTHTLRPDQLRRLERLGLLSGGLAHDLNNLLMLISGHAECALGDLGDPAAVAESLALIQESVSRALLLTNQLLAADVATPAAQRVELNTEIAVNLRLLRGRIGPQIKLVLALAQEPLYVEASPVQIQQVIQNVVLNAVEAIGQGSGQVTLATAIQSADSADCAEGRWAVWTVTDSGSGMDSAIQAQIFDPFFTTKLAGHGLGLAAVRAIVEGWRGAVRVQSAPGQGTLLTVLVPLGD